MISDRDTYRTAFDYLKRHGDTAPIFAAMEADALLEAGDLDGAATWRRILGAVRQMQHDRPAGAVH